MNNTELLNSKTVFFSDNTYISFDELKRRSYKVASYLKKNHFLNKPCVLIEIEDPLSSIIALFAVWQLGHIAALINPKMISSAKKTLLENLGPFVLLKCIQEDEDSYMGMLDDHKTCLLLASSGSQGDPKWIASSLHNWIYSAKGTNFHLDAKCYEPWILNLPLFHVSGLSIVFRALLSNAPLIISKNMTFDYSRYSFIPRQINDLHKSNSLHKYLKASSLLIGGGQIDQITLQKLSGFPFYLTYGMTEGCSSITMSEKGPKTKHVGQALLYRKVTLSNEGDISIKGESICDFKWDKGSLYKLKNDQGFLCTGDLGTTIQDNLIILGRKDERIEMNGEKIHPDKIEAALHQHYRFDSLVITHIKPQDHETIICAFSKPVPNLDEQIALKIKVGSLFFPKYFFELKEPSQNQKIILKDLKKEALSFIYDKDSQNGG
jgi:o-succinylbenzoate---CoA ligase